MKKLPSSFKLGSSAFALVYLAIAISTFSHTAWAGSFIFEGVPPAADQIFASLKWGIGGALLAVAVDVGMFVTAHQLPRSSGWERRVLLLSFIVAAGVSAFTQLLYVGQHSAPFVMSEGISEYWRGVLEPLYEARVVIMPISLPVFAILYTVTRMFMEHPAEGKDEHSAIVVPPVPQKPPVEVKITSPETKPALTSTVASGKLLNPPVQQTPRSATKKPEKTLPAASAAPAPGGMLVLPQKKKVEVDVPRN